MSISARAKLNEIAFNFEYSNNSQYSQVELKFVTKMHRLYAIRKFKNKCCDSQFFCKVLAVETNKVKHTQNKTINSILDTAIKTVYLIKRFLAKYANF